MRRWYLNDFQDFGTDECSAFGDYHPYKLHRARGGDFHDYPAFSGRILDLKDCKERGIRHFYELIEPLIRKDVAIVTVPSHDPSKPINGIRDLAQRICTDDPRIDATEVLVRAKLAQKLAHGGDRTADNHLKTIRVESPHLIRGRKVLLLDDVVSTGNSLRACKQMLEAAGARSVHCAALGKTNWE